MTKTTNNNLETACFSASFVVSAVVIYGWRNEVYELTNFGGEITTKAVTATCLLLLAFALQFRERLPVASRMVATFTLIYSIASMLSVDIPQLAREPKSIALMSTAPGIPSWATVILITAWSIAIEFQTLIRGVGWLSIIGSLVCLVGHALNVDWMIYYFSAWSSAMAIPTAIVFLLLGVAGVTGK